MGHARPRPVRFAVRAVAAVPAIIWWYGFDLAHLFDLAADGVAVTLIVCISTPIQVLLLRYWRGSGARALPTISALRCRVKANSCRHTCRRDPHCRGEWDHLALGRNIVSDFQLNIYRTASATGYLTWLWLAVVVIAPIGEETLFRGFLFRGWHRAPHDAWPVIIVTALLWAIIHPQYDLYFIAQVFAFGLVLGWFRWITGSTILTMLMHGLINCEGMIETFMALATDAAPRAAAASAVAFE